MRGIARDLAAAGLGKLKPEPKFKHKVEGEFDVPVAIKLDFTPETANACPVFAGALRQGRQKRPVARVAADSACKAVGLRPINALVDVTNYISNDRGRPLHVYDADKLHGSVRARLGEPGEKFVALDGKEYAVDPAACASSPTTMARSASAASWAARPQAARTTTKNVLIESACFDPVRTAATGRKAGITSDARYRFERGVDPASVRPGLDQATRYGSGIVRRQALEGRRSR